MINANNKEMPSTPETMVKVNSGIGLGVCDGSTDAVGTTEIIVEDVGVGDIVAATVEDGEGKLEA